ncbi:MAG: hypothetical protein JWQ57_4905 [Mucilaginibacter sp.]|nr:hypothetical protein [Mucilaginibacter sp.]
MPVVCNYRHTAFEVRDFEQQERIHSLTKVNGNN